MVLSSTYDVAYVLCVISVHFLPKTSTTCKIPFIAIPGAIGAGDIDCSIFNLYGGVATLFPP